MYHFSTVSGTVSIEKILLMIEVRIPLEKKLMRASSFFISLRAAFFLNWEMCSGRGRELLTFVVVSQAMAWSLIFS